MILKFEDIVEKLLKIKSKHSQLVIGVDGGGGAGKSTFATILAKNISAQVIQLDDLYKPKKDRLNENQSSDLNLDFDWERIEKEIFEPIRQNLSISYARYDWPADMLREKILIPKDKPIIIEGGYSLQNKFFDDYDFTVWIETPEDIRLARAMIRDGEHMRTYWEQTWLPADRRFKDRQKPFERASLHINGKESNFVNNLITTVD